MKHADVGGIADPDLFKAIDSQGLLEMLGPYSAYLNSHGFEFPATGQEPDYARLASVLNQPGEDAPGELMEALAVVASTGVPERFDQLLEIAPAEHVECGPDISPLDLAVRIWIKVPEVLARLHRSYGFEKKLKFECFPMRRGLTAPSPASLPTNLAPLEDSFNAWCREHQRGTGVRVYPTGNEKEVRWLIEHGQPCRRERHRFGDASKPAFFRPERTDLAIYDAERGELRVRAGTVGEMRLYVQQIGRYLFGDPEFFECRVKYTLEPLRQRGRKALGNGGIGAIAHVVLRELHIFTAHPFSDLEISRTDDVFLSMSRKSRTISPEAELQKAVFAVKLWAQSKPEIVTVEPPASISFNPGKADVLEPWLRAQQFILVGKDAEDEEPRLLLAGA